MGIIFSIEEFAVYDGDGIRTTVFFKGCPLRCNWCHNPEGLSVERQIVKNKNGCLNCGKCIEVCEYNGKSCKLCGKCIDVCPKNLIRFSGTEITAEELAEKLLKNADILNSNGGGITFSGGECLMQGDFLLEVISLIKGKTHIAIETCGYAPGDLFKTVTDSVDLVMFDLKIMDDFNAIKYTGKDTVQILRNFKILNEGKTPFIVRVPLIPGVTDTIENMQKISDIVKGSRALRVELLPYNKMAGSKYKLIGKEYRPKFDDKKDVIINTEIFNDNGIKVKVM